MKFFDVLTVLGALIGAGTALDFSVRKSAKQQFTAWLTRVVAADSNYSYNGTVFLDRIFGKGLLSWKATIRYMTISFISICVSYLFAYMTTTPTSPDDGLGLFPSGISLLPFAVLCVCVVFAMLGDIASYSITRIFIRTVDSYQVRTVSLGLVVADIITSLSLFFISFSIARIFSYILVVQFGALSPIKSEVSYVPELLSDGLHVVGAFPVVNSATPSTSQAISIAHGETKGELEGVAGAFRLMDFKTQEERARFSSIQYSAERKCASPEDLIEKAQAIKNTYPLLIAMANEQNSLRAEKISQDQINEVMGRYSGLSDAASPCATHLLLIARSVPVSGLMAVAGPVDAYLAAAERTLYDAYLITGHKLSPYVYFDPYESIDEYVQSLSDMVRTSFLGIAIPDSQKDAIFSRFPPQCQVCTDKKETKVRVPFSPMAASSLTSSLFFLGYLATLGIALVRQKVSGFISWCIPRFDLDKAVFTTLAIALCTIFAGVIFAETMFTLAWEIAFR